MRWLKHAFAVDEPGPIQPTAEQQPVVEKICVEVVRRHLATPALLLLEMGRPLNHLTSQAMHFFRPLVSALTDAEGYRHFAMFLERRGSIDYLCQRIEKLEADAHHREDEGSAIRDHQCGVRDDAGRILHPSSLSFILDPLEVDGFQSEH